MKIGVIGGGAIGLLVSTYLSRLGHDITIYVRNKEQKDEINNQGVHLVGERPTKVTALFFHEYKEQDYVFVCVKSYQLASVIHAIKAIEAPTIFLQNGMGHVDDLQSYQLEQDIIVGTCEHGAMKKNHCSVHHTGFGKINLASLNGERDSLIRLVRVIDHPAFPFKEQNNWYKMLGEKLVVNAVINTITSIFQVKNGEILTNPYLESLAQSICNEVCVVLGFDQKREWRNVKTIIDLTKENNSSMKEDIFYNRQTEIESIIGYLLKHAKSSLPNLSFVYNAVNALQYIQEEGS
ncbi:2-dehydropantoate 2-reductase [Aquibacillus koreensis]|uniref:2-dehydropantoate 2-reductase n=1 Tax=Aquibacillus koreensis TaxID=279446 RepID=A0A9X4AJR2_9BACI|nr:2-dehydropantoate 2-reductase [Aquibacillus koreensis]MCT2538070.1 2-dehydropantoate 2-reductase [Aquibacillus koreensis]MDC3420593.1 2-dehydropantoate 2-reductase [Aquibacillus koreensis]